MTKPHILTFDTYETWDIGPMEASYRLHPMPDSGNVSDLPDDVISKIRAIAFKGHGALTAEIMDALPNLAMIANYGVGYDTIDVAHATRKGIRVSNTPDVLTEDVADLAVGMIIAQFRGIAGADDWVKSGNWSQIGSYPLQRKVSGKRIGIVGLGRIGRAIAERLAPFNVEISYYARQPKEAPEWSHVGDIETLARDVDIMVVSLSGGPDTHGMVGKPAIEALGPNGLLVNISRGTTLDEAALLDALESGKLGAAALDVFLQEPDLDSRFLKLGNVLLQPHQSSGTIETRKAIGKLQRDNLAAFFAGKALISPVN